MPSKLADLLEILRDGKWHPLYEIQQETKISESQVRQITGFLGEYGFAVVDKDKGRIKLARTAQRFLAQTSTA